MLGSFQLYILLTQGFNAAARWVVKTLGLEPLEDPTFWAKEDAQPGADGVFSLFQMVSFADEVLPKFMALIQHEAVSLVAVTPGEKYRQAILTLVLPEQANEYSRPQRLVDSLTSVTLLYEALATIENEPA